jgi:LTXXQ motif family protein
LLPNISPARAMEVMGAQASASINIARIKNVLKLTPAQEHHWAPVEAALRDLARKQQAQTESTSLVRRISNRVVTVVLNSAAVQRLAVAARPLVASLDHEQMRAAQGLAQEMGLGPVVAALR